MHDERYKTIFAFPRMVEDLLCGFAARAWADELDFSTLRKVPAEWNLVTVVVWLEQSRSQSDLIPATRMLWDCLRSPEDDDPRQVFSDWMREILQRVLPEGEKLPAKLTLEDVNMTLVERAAEWPKQWVREGIEQGLERGREEGREEGIERGLAHERALLRRMAASRFGADTAEHLSEVLAGIADPERLAEVGEWLVRCDTGDEFLARVAPARSEGDHGDMGARQDIGARCGACEGAAGVAGDVEVGGGGGPARRVEPPWRNGLPQRPAPGIAFRSPPQRGPSGDRRAAVCADVTARDAPGRFACGRLRPIRRQAGARPTKDGNTCPVGSDARCP